MIMISKHQLLTLFSTSILVSGLGVAAGELTIPGVSDLSKLVPVSVEGFTGDAGAAIRFDLEVAGFEITTPDKALLQISGSSGGNLTGRVADRNRSTLLSKQYTGGSPRAQAHAFTDDIVALLPGRQGIARTKIAFRTETRGISEILLADYDGYNALPVTQDKTINRDVAWVPGQRILYYTSYRTGNPYVYSHNLQSGARQLVAGYSGVNAAPAVSPDGRRIAMILSKGGSPDVYVASADGSNLRRLTSTKEDESSPCWSPDGRRICFASRAGGWAQLYTVSADGGPMTRLTTTEASRTTEPDWSPDGKTIVFTAQMGGFQICTVPSTGGRATILAAGEDPSWAPNSRTVIFTRRVGGERVLSLLDVPTKRVKDVRRISGSCSQPAWAR
jgi:TolB protein